jgi:hypothetical protein
MKRILLNAIVILLFIPSIYAQTSMSGMKYQAVARNLEGKVLANQDIFLKIKLQSNISAPEVHYSEIHNVTTNQFGLFAITVGGGISKEGAFNDIPWSSEDIWMQVAIKDKKNENFTSISESQLFAVPYAFHAISASKLFFGNNEKAPGNGVPSNVWSLFGNSNSDDTEDRLGTTDCQDLVIITNSIERLRITCEGVITITGDFNVADCGSTHLTGTLEVDKETTLHSTLQVDGETDLESELRVNNDSPTDLSGTLNVDGVTDLNNHLNVDGVSNLLNTTQSNTKDDGALIVEGGVGIEKNVNVGGNASIEGETNFGSPVTISAVDESTSTTDGALIVFGGTGISKNLNVGGITKLVNTTQSSSKDNGALVVEGGVGIEKNVNIGGIAKLVNTTESSSKDDGALVVEGGVGIEKNLSVGGSATIKTSTQDFVATIFNEHSDGGNGLLIKLGKPHPTYTGGNPAYLNVPDPFAAYVGLQAANIKSMITSGSFELANITNYLNNVNTAEWQAGTACSMAEQLAGALNDGLLTNGANLLDGYNLFNGQTVDILPTIWRFVDPWVLDAIPDDLYGYDEDDDCDHCGLLAVTVPAITLPNIPLPNFPTDFCPDFLPSFPAVNLQFTDVNGTLNSDNQFIKFQDKDDKMLGTIRAMGVVDWQQDYFDNNYAVNFVASIVGIDPLDALTGAISEFSNIVKSYNNIGVEYASGHGDYAEWLERLNPDEHISKGDIVAVIGGKITKDLSNAEQIMAVSEHPIVLGNLPPDGSVHLGNNVAFMGQIPVKVMGPVESGDYILASDAVPGYGIAKKPSQVDALDMIKVVGRSWETVLGDGPKLVNTVVGVHNGDYFKILMKYQKKFEANEARMDDIEAKLSLLMGEGSK